MSPAVLAELLPSDGSTWRLTYAGPIVKVVERRTPCVTLRFAPFEPRNRTRTTLVSQTSIDDESGHIIKAAVSDISWFRLGSLWTDGRPEDYPDYEENIFDLEIANCEAQIRRGYDKSNEGWRYIPRTRYRIWNDVSQGSFLVLQSKGKYERLIIPCFEIFRFYYFGVSGKFGTALIDGSHIIRRYETVDEPRCSWPDRNGNAHVRLGRSVDNVDRVEIARATFAEIARRNVEMLIPRMATRYASSGLTIGFPFEGSTKLTVRGVNLQTFAPRSFLALTIEQCTGPMPFKHLTYARANASTRDRPVSASVIIRKGGARAAPQPSGAETPPYTQRSDPRSRDAPFEAGGMLQPERYGGTFTEAEVERGPIRQRRVSHQLYCQETYGEVYASGVAAREANARAMVLTAEQARTLSDQLVQFRKTIHALCAVDRDVKVSHLDHYVLPPYPRNVKHPGAWSWSYLDGLKRINLRRASVAIITYRSSAFAIVEIERRSSEQHSEFFQTAVFAPPKRSISGPDIEIMLDFIVRQRGVMTGSGNALTKIMPGWSVTGSWHIGKNAKERAQRLREAIVRKLCEIL